MSHQLWKSYWQDDVDRFRRLLAPGGYNPASAASSRSPNIGGTTSGGGIFPGAAGSGGASPGAFGTSPRFPPQTKAARRSSAFGASAGAGGGSGGSGTASFGKAEVNSRDHAGLTILLRASASSLPSSVAFVRALLDHPAVDIYVRDPESGWNALHRALYAGNISVARLLLAKERADLADSAAFVAGGSSISRIGQLIKTKDHEGNSPFDLLAASIGERALPKDGDVLERSQSLSDDGSEGEEPLLVQRGASVAGRLQARVDGDELFMFGSNKNMSLGVGDESDRQYPERVHLRRPDHLFHRFYDELLEQTDRDRPAPGSLKLDELPAMILTRPLEIQDVVLSKFHSAVLTTDPISNLYICGVGRGGRLGLSDDQRVRFTYVPVQGGLADRKVVQAALGQDHSMAVTDTGELWTWGSNACSQLGYSLPPPTKADEVPMSLTPRQVFGPLRKETVEGVAASAVHSVAHTGTSLYCWGKNLGQLALMDSDSRSLEFQPIPRKVAASLFSCPIAMVSAIDKATAVLLTNHTVCVFTSYGYNMVKFPTVDPFTNYRMRSFVPRIRGVACEHSGQAHKICHIAAGGETIAAVTGRGDLFVMGLNLGSAGDANSSASTTNPSKIKEAVGQPQCIWSARKDGVRSVGVGEHGSVIICTESGAVWRRVKRATAKDAYTGAAASSADLKRKKDFKFQRVPYISKVVGVRNSAFGAFAAVRRDSHVMKEQISIDKQTIWDDLTPLICLFGFSSSEKSLTNERAFNLRAVPNSQCQLPRALLRSSDLEEDLIRHLASAGLDIKDYDATIRSSSHPDIKIPIHSWILSARSPVFRAAFAKYRAAGSYASDDFFTIEPADGKAEITVTALDLITVLNLVIYLYLDQVVAFWNLPRLPSAQTQKYRQIRVDLMKVAAKLGLSKLEAAARIQNEPTKSMAADLDLAHQDSEFMEEGDVVIELNGDEATAHSALLRRRCPYFEGFFHGRSEGMWLATRRDAAGPSGRVSIDLKHFDPEPFGYVLRHLYGDVGEELFDLTVVPTFDDFTDLIMDILAIANELMLDRLSRVCQKVMGRFVTTRTIAGLLNEISPCSVTEFKDAGLEYICMQIETMLENHLLEDLDEELLLELDEVVRDNQRAHCPNASGTWTEESLHQRNPALATDIQEERQIRVKEMAFKATQRDDEKKLSTSFKARAGSLDDGSLNTIPATPDKTERAKKPSGRNEPFSPSLRPKASAADLMFDMDDDEEYVTISPFAKPRQAEAVSGSPKVPQKEEQEVSRGEQPSSPQVSRQLEATARRPSGSASNPVSTAPTKSPGSPWQPSSLATEKLDLRKIMTETSTARQSALSAGLAAASPKTSQTPRRATQAAKPSQQEKKRQLQAAQEAAAALESSSGKATGAWETPRPAPGPAASSPWKATPTTPKTSLKDMLAPATAAAPIAPPKPLVATESSAYRRTASPDTRFPGQSRKPKTGPQTQPSPSSPAPSPQQPLTPHSKSYIPSPSAAAAKAASAGDGGGLLLSMADIIGQQRREQELMREAVAKRSLQEIQQEQEFQEWWDQESRRTQEEEARRLAREARARGRGEGGGGGGGAGVGAGAQGGDGPEGGGGGGGGRGRRGRRLARGGNGGGGGGGSGPGQSAAALSPADKTAAATVPNAGAVAGNAVGTADASASGRPAVGGGGGSGSNGSAAQRGRGRSRGGGGGRKVGGGGGGEIKS